jgi:hypothetical protein
MTLRLKVLLPAALAVLLLAGCTATVAGAATCKTSKPVLSAPPQKDKAFTASGFITPKSTSSSRATVKIILWMKYGDGWGVMDTYTAKLAKRPAGKAGTAYSIPITIPMKGEHGVQAVQYRRGKVVSKSATTYFDVKP